MNWRATKGEAGHALRHLVVQPGTDFGITGNATLAVATPAIVQLPILSLYHAGPAT